MAPEQYPKRILLCVTGLSPQIVTETLYALVRSQQPAFIPTEIHIITTREGAERVNLTLLHEEHGHFPPLCADYGLDLRAVRFDHSTVHLIPDPQGQPLADIRDRQDNVSAADTITRVVRDLTQDPESSVHASIAGGRKTMGFFLGYALSLFGRPQDRLSHVLVSPPFESHPQFYYPPAKPRVLYARDNRPIDTRNADVILADIPFVRLREGLDHTLLAGHNSFSETVERAQQSLQPPELVLDLATRRIRCAGHTLTLAPAPFALLALLARYARHGRDGLSRQRASQADADDFLALYNDLPGARNCASVQREGLTQAFLEQKVCRINNALTDALGPGRARPYLIVNDGPQGHATYRLGLAPNAVRFDCLSTDA